MNKSERISLRDAVRFLPGIGEKRAALFAKLGVITIRDLLYHFPRAYQNRGEIRTVAEAAKELAAKRSAIFRAALEASDIQSGEDGISAPGERSKAPLSMPPAAYMLTVGSQPKSARMRGRMTLTKFNAFDESGSCTVTYFNQSYIADKYRAGDTYRFWGRLSLAGGRPSLISPESESAPEGAVLAPFVPVYRLTAGLGGRQIAQAVAAAFESVGTVRDVVPASLREKYGLISRHEALRQIHFPRSAEALRQAQEALFFEEVYLFTLGLMRSGRDEAVMRAPQMKMHSEEEFDALLPFAFTPAQKRAVAEIRADMCRSEPMKRMLSGDVGSGKTVCAAAAIYLCVKNGYQAALMAPTEILATQHYGDLSSLFERAGIRCALLTSSTRAPKRRQILSSLEVGALDLVIGTHSLISDEVKFARLGLVVTDEQHRFGVMQRAALSSKNEVSTLRGGSDHTCHMLVMSATPIPRTLALILYRDLTLSVLDGMPPGRQKVDTFVVGESYRERLNGFIRKQIDEGHQVYIVCPAVAPPQEDDELNGSTVLSPREAAEADELLTVSKTAAEVKNVAEYTERLKNEVLPELSIGCVHGRMKSAEKEDIMRRFAAGEVSVLVATTVIEVGVNVPNATLMIIENAERFGLAQLHQLRGRVGRGSAKSYCVLVSDFYGGQSTAAQRLSVMREMSDGFEIARRDLELRGPGDFFPGEDGGIRQHGGFAFRLAGSCASADLLKAAADAAAAVIEHDPTLSLPENAPAAYEADAAFGRVGDTVS